MRTGSRTKKCSRSNDTNKYSRIVHDDFFLSRSSTRNTSVIIFIRVMKNYTRNQRHECVASFPVHEPPPLPRPLSPVASLWTWRQFKFVNRCQVFRFRHQFFVEKRKLMIRDFFSVLWKKEKMTFHRNGEDFRWIRNSEPPRLVCGHRENMKWINLCQISPLRTL